MIIRKRSIFFLILASCIFLTIITLSRIFPEKRPSSESRSICKRPQSELWKGQIREIQEKSLPFRQQLSGSDWGANFHFSIIKLDCNNGMTHRLLCPLLDTPFVGETVRLRVRLLPDGEISPYDFVTMYIKVDDLKAVSVPYNTILKAEGIIEEIM